MCSNDKKDKLIILWEMFTDTYLMCGLLWRQKQEIAKNNYYEWLKDPH